MLEVLLQGGGGAQVQILSLPSTAQVLKVYIALLCEPCPVQMQSGRLRGLLHVSEPTCLCFS